MGAERVIRCGLPPARRPGPEVLELSLRQPGGNLTLKTADITELLVEKLPPLLEDLLEIATYVYGADQAIGRGVENGLDRGASWHRDMRFTIAVREPERWSSEPVRRALVDILSFASDDTYHFEFVPLVEPPPSPSFVQLDRTAAERTRVDEIVSFSGGLDSFAGAVQEIFGDGRSVVLVGHRAATKLDRKQRLLVEALQREAAVRAPDVSILHIPVWVQKTSELDHEATQRTRSFLFAALAATVARMLGRARFRFYENGIVSLNLPISGQVVGARATRTTHPLTLSRLEVLFTELFGVEFRIENPFLWRTKTEVVQVVEALGCAAEIVKTVSCAHVIDMTTQHTHCGTCSQCVDRRFAVLAAKLEAYDPEDQYRVALFTDEPETLEEITMIEGYVRRAREIQRMPEVGFFGCFGETTRVLQGLRGPRNENARRILDLYRRHSADVVRVLGEAFSRYSSALALGNLPPHCLLRMASGGGEAARPSASTTPDEKPASKPPVLKGRQKPINLLHVSDSHFSQKRTWDQDPVLLGLARDVDVMRAKGREFHAAIHTGDLAQSGRQEEYALADRWLREKLLPAAGLTPRDLWVVAGNHDVDRGRVNDLVRVIQAGLLKEGRQDLVAGVLGDPAQRQLLIQRHGAWLDFVNRLGVLDAPLDVPWYKLEREIHGFRIHFAGLCSSWMSCADTDQGQLLLGMFQARQVLDGAERADLVIAGLHHPPTYFPDFDSGVWEELHRRCNLILRGHLHRHAGTQLKRPDTTVLELAAGSSYAGSEYANSYQIITIDPGSSRIRVQVRLWDGHDWIADRNAYGGRAPKGYASFPLPRRRPGP